LRKNTVTLTTFQESNNQKSQGNPKIAEIIIDPIAPSKRKEVDSLLFNFTPARTTPPIMNKIATQQIGMSFLDKDRIRSDGLDKLARFLLITHELHIKLL
jgi:hypothetical protein